MRVHSCRYPPAGSSLGFCYPDSLISRSDRVQHAGGQRRACSAPAGPKPYDCRGNAAQLLASSGQCDGRSRSNPLSTSLAQQHVACMSIACTRPWHMHTPRRLPATARHSPSYRHAVGMQPQRLPDSDRQAIRPICSRAIRLYVRQQAHSCAASYPIAIRMRSTGQ